MKFFKINESKTIFFLNIQKYFLNPNQTIFIMIFKYLSSLSDEYLSILRVIGRREEQEHRRAIHLIIG